MPEHRAFVLKRLKPFVEAQGIKFVHLVSDKYYTDVFNHIIVRGARKGMKNGFVNANFCKVNRDCKLPPLRKYQRGLGDELTIYVGIEKDETERLLRMFGTNRVSLLEKYSYEKNDSYRAADRRGLLSPSYIWCNRNGCWFCPNCSEREWAHLIIDHPTLWKEIKKLEGSDNYFRKCLTPNKTPSEVENKVRQNGIAISLAELTANGPA